MSGTSSVRPQRPRTAGFTLIELLIALTLVGLLSTLLLGGLRFGTRVWESGQARSERSGQIEAVHGFLRRQLAQSRAERPQQQNRDETAGFQGDAEQLRFIAPFPDHLGLGGLYRFQIAPIDFEGGLALEMIWQPYRPDDFEWFEEGDDEVSRRRLIDAVESVNFGYYGRLDSRQEADWHENWDTLGVLPALVALEIEFPPGDERNWPRLVVAPYGAQALPQP